MAGAVRLWNNWEVQILVLVSFVLQVFLRMFAGMRRRNMSVVTRTLLWLAYLLADAIAVYILGHMSFCTKPHEKQQLMAFWAPFLLVHLGGQDTITAYSLEDNQLWPRHLLTFAVQALGVAYVLYKYIAGSWTLVTAAALIFVTGVLKYGERIWALKSASLDNMSKFLDGRKLREVKRAYKHYRRHAHELGPEEILQGAHDLLPICMAQLADYKFWPSPFQFEAIELFCGKGHMYELIEMQLSLVHDFLYTKVAVVFTWYGFFIRAISLVATITAFFLFQSSIGKNGIHRGDAIVTYILIVGAVLLEMAALLKAMGSTWTCTLLHDRRWDRLHSIVVSVRRHVKAGEKYRRWSGSIGQPKSLHGIEPGSSGGCIREIAKRFGLEYSGGCKDLLHGSLHVISDGTKKLVLGEVCRMVLECDGNEDIMRGYSGQCMLNQWHGFFEDPTSRAGIDFDDKILAWYFATKMFLSFSSRVEATQQGDVVEAIRAVSNYMVFLLVECPYMLPSPVRPGSYASSEAAYMGLHYSGMTGALERIRRWGERDRRNEELDKRREAGLDLDNMDIRRDDHDIELEKIRKELPIIGIEAEMGPLHRRRNELRRIRAELHRRDTELSRRTKELNKISEEQQLSRRRRNELDRNSEEQQKIKEREERISEELNRNSEEQLKIKEKEERIREELEELEDLPLGPSPPPSLARGAQLVESLLYMVGRGERKVLQVVLGVWVEMLCYAAHHCSRDSHARQLNSGGEFITITWLLSTAMFNQRYYRENWFIEGVQGFYGNDSAGLWIRTYMCRSCT